MGSTGQLPGAAGLPRSKPEEGVFWLPGGYVDEEGAPHREVELGPLTGREEEYLASMPASTPSANIITQLLARCVRRIGGIRSVDAPAIRKMLVGDREYLILKLRQITSGSKLQVIVSCQSAGCGKDMAIDVSLDEIPVEERPVTGKSFAMDMEGAGRLEFRLPTGDDQEQLAPYASEPTCVLELLVRCLLQAPPANLADLAPALEERMEQLSPRVSLEMEGVCPECGAAFSADVDLAASVLSDLVADPQRLRREIHFLAWHYHWPESEILAMPRRKRRRYIELLDEELERMNPS